MPFPTANQRGYIDAARRNQSLMRKGYRLAKKKGNIADALKFAQAGDEMGLAVGRPASHEATVGAGMSNYARDRSVAGLEPERTGLASRYREDAIPQLTLARNRRRDDFRQMWRTASTQAEKDSVVEGAYGEGIVMNRNAIPSLYRRGIVGQNGEEIMPNTEEETGESSDSELDDMNSPQSEFSAGDTPVATSRRKYMRPSLARRVSARRPLI